MALSSFGRKSRRRTPPETSFGRRGQREPAGFAVGDGPLLLALIDLDQRIQHLQRLPRARRWKVLRPMIEPLPPPSRIPRASS
jgi:hypothetical protein